MEKPNVVACNSASKDKTNQGSSEKPLVSKTILRTKEFVIRNSLIEDLVKDGSLSPIYSMYLATILGLIIHTVAYDYFYKGEINLGQRLIIDQFSGLPTFFIAWIPLFFSNFLVYYCFKYWATVKVRLPQSSDASKFWDNLWLTLTVMYYPGWIFITTWYGFKFQLSGALSMAYHCEVTRMLMKMHAFIRSNVPRVLSYKSNSSNAVLYPKDSQFMYFLWAPTLIYRDSYPRTKTTRWRYVAVMSVEFVLMLFLISVIFERYFIYNFKDYGKQTYGWIDVIVITVQNAGGGFLLMTAGMYAVLHLWQNAFAEICKFGDRRFYEDWWSSTTYERYYRVWNLIVYEWLHTYVYKDFYEIITPGQKFVAKYAVFGLSAMFHEYILICSLRFLMPVLIIQFLTFGTIFTYIKLKPDLFANVLLLYSLGIGNAINATFLSLEYYARLNCPKDDPTVYDFFVPRLFYCYK